jgi:hypothetical protein
METLTAGEDKTLSKDKPERGDEELDFGYEIMAEIARQLGRCFKLIGSGPKRIEVSIADSVIYLHLKP